MSCSPSSRPAPACFPPAAMIFLRREILGWPGACTGRARSIWAFCGPCASGACSAISWRRSFLATSAAPRGWHIRQRWAVPARTGPMAWATGWSARARFTTADRDSTAIPVRAPMGPIPSLISPRLTSACWPARAAWARVSKGWRWCAASKSGRESGRGVAAPEARASHPPTRFPACAGAGLVFSSGHGPWPGREEHQCATRPRPPF